MCWQIVSRYGQNQQKLTFENGIHVKSTFPALALELAQDSMRSSHHMDQPQVHWSGVLEKQI